MKRKQKVSKWIYWTPRVLSIAFILFLALFSLDVFDMHAGFWGTVLGLLIHNIPSFVLTAVLVFSWKYEIVGGIGFILGGLVYFFLIMMNCVKHGFHWYYVAWIGQISGIAFLIGILFLVGWFRKSA
ncbi:hypothetical protein JW898_02095 [Candidatus Woesearchaeota archaeon]|nr:hypothetical protein [Candidatus Woesearchaeota archaeon]